MEKFEKVTKPFEGDFYSITEQDGVKIIHINGYTYKSDSKEYVTEQNPNGVYWANLEVCWFIFTLEEFIKNYKEKGAEWIDECYEERSQYQGDFTEEQMLDSINNRYFNGRPADAYLDFCELTEDTPCGNYICLSY